MKAVMKSVSPRICEKVANGDCTILVSKTAPKCEVPFKGYICCTKSTRAHVFHLYINDGIGRQNFGITGHWRSGKKVVEVNPHLPAYRYNSYLAEGKAIGEFVCDKVDKIIPLQHTYYNYIGLPIANVTEYGIWNDDLAQMCLKKKEIDNYGKGKMLYGWHISDLKIYDKPKELSEFKTPPCEKGEKACANCKWRVKVDTPERYECECYVEDGRPITRAPQSWQYVEEL